MTRTGSLSLLAVGFALAALLLLFLSGGYEPKPFLATLGLYCIGGVVLSIVAAVATRPEPPAKR